MTCTHDLAEMETACADGFCPLCMRERIAALAQELAETLAHNKQLLADEDASPAIIAGYRDNNTRLQGELAEAQRESKRKGEYYYHRIKLMEKSNDQLKEALETTTSWNHDICKENSELRDAVREYKDADPINQPEKYERMLELLGGKDEL